MTQSDTTATPIDPIPLRAERSRRLMVALVVFVAVLVVAVAIFAFGGQMFGPDPMAGT